MSIDEVRDRLGEIREAIAAGDIDRARHRETWLWGSALFAIATGDTDDPRALAAEAVKSWDIAFDRFET